MRIILSLAAMIAAIFATVAYAQDDQLTVVNNTGYTIAELYISPTATSRWEEDILGDVVLDAGDTTVIDFTGADETCWWDIKIVYLDDEEEVVWDELDFCNLSGIVIHYDEDTGETSVTTD